MFDTAKEPVQEFRELRAQTAPAAPVGQDPSIAEMTSLVENEAEGILSIAVVISNQISGPMPVNQREDRPQASLVRTYQSMRETREYLELIHKELQKIA